MPDDRPGVLMLDVDGVVITGRLSDGRHWSTDLEHDLGVPRDRLKTEFFKPYWADIVCGRKELSAVLSQVLPAIAPQVSPDQLMRYWFTQDARLDRAVIEQVATLRAEGWQVHLATNQDHQRADDLWHRQGLCAHFDGIVYSARLGAAKPAPAFFAAAESAVAATPDQLILVDDTAANVAAAQAAGWRAAHWETGHDLLAICDTGK